jgi:hypothetical protein
MGHPAGQLHRRFAGEESFLVRTGLHPGKITRHPRHDPPGAEQSPRRILAGAVHSGIHGTAKPLGVGRRVSHGCIRLYPEDIKDLFRRVSLETPVWIIYQPVKVGLRDNRLYIEVHPSQTIRADSLLNEAMRQVSALDWEGRLDLAALHKAIWEQRGVPTPISLPENPAPGPD